mgnify:CR=1 FL=1
MARSTRSSETNRPSKALLGAPRQAGGYKHLTNAVVDFHDSVAFFSPATVVATVVVMVAAVAVVAETIDLT